MIVHLILLFEEKDEVGLASHGRNYRRKLEKMDALVKPALAIVSVLQRQIDLEMQIERPALLALIPQLEAFSLDPAFELSLFYPELLLWLQSQKTG
jgi:hypothetical protein